MLQPSGVWEIGTIHVVARSVGSRFDNTVHGCTMHITSVRSKRKDYLCLRTRSGSKMSIKSFELEMDINVNT